jgi:hypothetical protein
MALLQCSMPCGVLGFFHLSTLFSFASEYFSAVPIAAVAAASAGI